MLTLKRATASDPEVQMLERGALVFKPATTDAAIGFSWYRGGPLAASRWSVQPAKPGGDTLLRAVPLVESDAYRTAARLEGGTTGAAYVVTCRGTAADGPEDQAAVIVVPGAEV